MMFHFGERDSHIPLSDVDTDPQGESRRASSTCIPPVTASTAANAQDFDQASAQLAFERTIEFFRKHVG